MVLHMLARENFNIKVRIYMIVSKQGQKISLRANLLVVMYNQKFLKKIFYSRQGGSENLIITKEKPDLESAPSRVFFH